MSLEPLHQKNEEAKRSSRAIELLELFLNKPPSSNFYGLKTPNALIFYRVTPKGYLSTLYLRAILRGLENALTNS